MKALTYLSLALALGACLLSVSGLAGSGDSPRSSSVVAGRDDELLREELSSLRASTGELVEELRSLDERLTAMELVASTSKGPREPVALEAALEDSAVLENLAAALESGQAGSSNELQNLVLDVIASKEEADRLEREGKRLQATQDRVNERVERYRDELGLDSRQANDMARVLVEEELKRDELFSQMREGGGMGRESIREGMMEIRDVSRDELSRILTPEQYDGYVEMSDWRRGGRDRGPDPGGRGGGGGRRGGGRDV